MPLDTRKLRPRSCEKVTDCKKTLTNCDKLAYNVHFLSMSDTDLIFEKQAVRNAPVLLSQKKLQHNAVRGSLHMTSAS